MELSFSSCSHMRSLAGQALLLIAAMVALVLSPAVASAQNSCKNCPVGKALEEQFPEAPEPVTRRADGGLKHDLMENARIRRAERSYMRKFWIAHGVFLATNVFDIEMTHQRIAHYKCVEGGEGIVDPHASRGEMYRKDMIVFGAITGMDLLFAKARPPKAFKWVPFIGSSYGTVMHLRAGIRWRTGCW